MRKYGIILLFFAIPLGLKAQVGLGFGFLNSTASEWEDVLSESSFTNEERFLKSGFRGSIDYWFRLKNHRVEFLPEIGYSMQKQEIATASEANSTFGLDIISFTFNVNIYPLDFDGDCNCPTFSKGNDFFKKGFFFQVSPGYSYYQTNFNDDVKETATAFNIGLGLGIDLGISEFLTISPYIRGIYYPKQVWDNLNSQLTQQNILTKDETVNRQFLFGIRLGFRFDEINKYGYR